MKVILTVVAAVLAAPVLIGGAAGGVVSLFFGDGTNRVDCAPAGSTSARMGDYGPEQMANAATIVAVGKQMSVPEQGWVVAIATAMQESRLRNLDHGDRDSLGLFQQRPSQGWGSPAQIMDPTYSATQFYQHLLTVPGWQQMSVTDAAQTVQRSAFPHAYARHEHAAQQVVAAVHGSTCTTTPTGTWTLPVSGRCSSGFGPRDGQFHRGQDIAAPIGTTIVAANGGRVIDAGPANGYGLWVRIQHSAGIITTYGHNHRNLVQPGQTVHTGQPIAEVGNRGQSTGPHLHFQVEIDNQAVDPTAFYRQQQALPLCGDPRG